MPELEAVDWLSGQQSCPEQTQISREIDYFQSFYGTLHPVVFLSYDREAFYSVADDDFRMTFDENILYREEDLSLTADIYGTPLLKKDQVLMELKTAGGFLCG